MSHAGLPDPHRTSNPGFSISMTRMSLTSAVNRRRIFVAPRIPPLNPKIDKAMITVIVPNSSSTSVVILGCQRPNNEILQPLQPYKVGVTMLLGAKDDLYIPEVL